MENDALPELTLFPYTAATGNQGHPAIGGGDTVALSATYGTPLYIFDETTLRTKCSEYRLPRPAIGMVREGRARRVRRREACARLTAVEGG